MTRKVVFCLMACAGVYGQTPASPQFEVATVKPVQVTGMYTSGITTGHGRLAGENVTLKRCIMGAYGVGPREIVGGPEWLDTDRFQIVARAETAIDDDDVLMVMLRRLLVERFHLELHKETRTLSGFVLEVAKNGPKMEKSTTEGDSATDGKHGALDARNTDMDLFAKVLARTVGYPVVNQTGLEGRFNFKLKWTPEQDTPTKDSGPSIYTALQEQLGLRLRSQKAPVEVLVIDRAEKPTEN